MKDCNQCGKCCIKYGSGGLSASQQEIDLWEVFNPEVYRYVKNNEIWFHPETGTSLEVYPFLEIAPPTSASSKPKYNCSIYFNRPEDCRLYPSLVTEIIRDECEMIELQDITQPEKAQKQLDKRMADSRR